MGQIDLSTWQEFNLPWPLRGLKCPTCTAYMKGFLVRHAPGEKDRKFASPCTHEISPEQEQRMVQDILSKGL